MKTFVVTLITLLLASCASAPSDNLNRRDPIRNCPVGWVLICETARDQEPGSGSDEEIPQYDRCYCEDAMR